MDYIEPLITCDKILDLFDPESRVSISQSDIYRSIGKKGDPFTFQALKRLKEDGYLDNRSADENFSFNGKTAGFISSGKYKGLCERENIRISNLSSKGKLEEEQIKSVIATNKAVQENFKFQEKFLKRSLWLTFLSIFFIGITAYLQYQDKTAQRVEELKQEVKETSKTLKELQSSVKEVNSSIQKPKTDTVFLKQK